MKLKHVLSKVLVAASLIAAGVDVAQASLTDTIGGYRGTQQGRISRAGIPQDWTGGEVFGGVINPTVTYYYATFALNVGSLNYLDINVDSVSTNTFLSVYQGSFDPLNLALNWLGDSGTSRNYFGTDPLFVDVVAAMNSVVYLVMTTTNVGTSALADPFTLLVSAYPDSSFNSAPVELQPLRVPEPSTMLLLLAPLALLGARRFAKRDATNDGMALAA